MLRTPIAPAASVSLPPNGSRPTIRIASLDGVVLPPTERDWREVAAEKFKARLDRRIAKLTADIDYDRYGANARRVVTVSLSNYIGSWHYFTVSMPWAVFCELMTASIEREAKKKCEALTLASLQGGDSLLGARCLQQNVTGFDIVGLDFDKGGHTREQLEARRAELGVEGFIHESYSTGTTSTTLTWVSEDGDGSWLDSKFKEYVVEHYGIEDVEDVTGEHAKAYLVDAEGYNADTLGSVTVGSEPVQSITDEDRAEIAIRVAHDPITKLRLFLLLDQRVERLPGESNSRFQERYERECYLPVAKWFSPWCDHSCKTIERRWYCRGHRPGFKPVPGSHGPGVSINPATDERIVAHREVPKRPEGAERPANDNKAGSNSDEARADWRGFLAADALVALLSDAVIDKRDTDNPGVAADCPFRHNHGKSKHGKHQLYVRNADAANRVPVVKCQSETCQGHGYKWEDYLAALFGDDLPDDPKYWLNPSTYDLPVTSNFVVPLGRLGDALLAMNRRWSVVRIGGRTRYMVFRHDGIPEFLDKTNLLNEFGAAYYEKKVVNNDGEEEIELRPFLPLWLNLPSRTQYRGYGFFPAPAGHPLAAPEGVFNAYRGPTVEAKPGSWKRLLAHLYRNVCLRDPERFRWLVGYVAQMVQEPHVKPGTHIVLCGNEGTGKSKLGEWLIRLLKPCAMAITSRERLTGRFNAHFERLLFGLAEEVFWAGDKEAEGAIKALATAEELDYERKGIDPEPGRNYTRLMICSNEDWVVPAGSGGRRWFVLRVGNEHEQDNAYFAAIDDEMDNGGLEAMLYDLQHSPLAKTVNVRKAPVTPWLIEQRLHSQDARKMWWRTVLAEGGFSIESKVPGQREFIRLDKTDYVSVRRDDIFGSAQPFFDRKGRPATRVAVRAFIVKELESHPSLFYDGGREGSGARKRTYIIAGYDGLRDVWFDKYGERIEDADEGTLPVHSEAESETGEDALGCAKINANAISDSRD